MALLNTLVGSEEFGGTATGALTADAPGGKPGPRLAAALLEVSCCLAQAGPPAAWAQKAAQGGRRRKGQRIFACGRWQCF